MPSNREKILIKRIALALALCAGFLVPGVTMAVPQAGACSQSIRTTHNNYSATVTILIRYCNRSYRSWARFSDGHNVKGVWRTAAGSQSVSYDSHGGNQAGGYQWERTGGGTIYTHESY
jgi:hypothetical protein